MATDENDVRWGVRRRFEFIEWRAYWSGRLNRRDLEEQFHISTPQASNDLKAYQDVAAGNIAYNAGEKSYFATLDFDPKFLALSPERYLLQLQALTAQAIRKDETWFDKVPPTDVAPTIVRGPQAYALRAIVKAIESKSAMAIYYQSLTHAGMRTICPHALAYDGFRWHVRALSLEREEYRDYVLGRILSYSVPTEWGADSSDDLEWHRTFDLRLTAHPGLTPEQKAAIERDYRLQDGVLVVPVRLALGYYFIKRHNLDLNLDPLRAQLHLENLHGFDEASRLAKAQSKELVATRKLRKAAGIKRT